MTLHMNFNTNNCFKSETGANFTDIFNIHKSIKFSNMAKWHVSQEVLNISENNNHFTPMLKLIWNVQIENATFAKCHIADHSFFPILNEACRGNYWFDVTS